MEQSIIQNALKTLKREGLVIFPSDTVYGLLTDATSEHAVQKLIRFKNRPPGKPISVFVSGMDMLKDLVFIDRKQEELIRQLLPGPFTLILPAKNRVNRLLLSEKETLGVRIPEFQPVMELVRRFGKPITATSANLSGRPPHYQISTLLKEFTKEKKNLIDYIVDIGKLPRNKPSTIVDLTGNRVKTLREGDILFSSKKQFISTSPADTEKIAQFVLSKHLNNYRKPLVFIIKGELGSGKTVFVKGIGRMMGITNIISPTYTVYYEYPVKDNQIKQLVHFDLYNVQDKDEFNYLGIDNYLHPGIILCFEWGEKSGVIIEKLKKKSKIIEVNIRYVNENEREIEVKN